MVNYQELLDYYESFEILCAIWCHLYNFRNVKNTNGRVLLLVKLQAKASNFTESNTPLCVFHISEIVQMAPNRAKQHIYRHKLH